MGAGPQPRYSLLVVCGVSKRVVHVHISYGEQAAWRARGTGIRWSLHVPTHWALCNCPRPWAVRHRIVDQIAGLANSGSPTPFQSKGTSAGATCTPPSLRGCPKSALGLSVASHSGLSRVAERDPTGMACPIEPPKGALNREDAAVFVFVYHVHSSFYPVTRPTGLVARSMYMGIRGFHSCVLGGGGRAIEQFCCFGFRFLP